PAAARPSAHHTPTVPHHSTFSFYLRCCGDHRDLHSFPTRRSSDLDVERAATRRLAGAGYRSVWSGEGPGTREVFAHFGDQLASVDRKSTRLNSSHSQISYAVFCLKKKTARSRATINVNAAG